MKDLDYTKIQTKKVKEIIVWDEGEYTTVCLGKIEFWFFIKAVKTWIFNTCLEIKGRTVSRHPQSK